ncbi:putative glycoside hydrolase [Echinimonas agarilytica]|uniref:NADH:ubiquinone oxidoreductase intermediate-associated protein 30 domain-containing protein n=1 Tax=Echinimonas agarilytica TaxID=1215918 RepID=A0AA41W4E2_9GAMM|nr:putative glycoside hydrolase [Echinimonas agarilytica]MCM2678419.1 hypothetical protein [Echinimonas agarilytica]
MQYLISISCIISLLFPASLAAEEFDVFTSRGKPGRGLLELLGDPKSNEWARPISDHQSSPAFNVQSMKTADGERGRTIIMTGDNCGNGQCLAMYYIKSARGNVDLSSYRELSFDIEIIDTPKSPLLLRVGSWPSRIEVDVTPMLPYSGQGWKTIRYSMNVLLNNTHDNFDIGVVPDVFALSSAQAASFNIKNIRWQ